MRRDSRQKQVTFDIDVALLQKHYPDSKHWRRAYTDIKKEFESEGFKWREGSVYVSDKPISYSATRQIALKIKKSFPWLEKCMKDIRASNVGEFHDLTRAIKEGSIPSDNKKLSEVIFLSQNKHCKQLVFDLLQANMDKDHPGMSKWAYSHLRTFLERRGFKRIQQTGYESEKPMTMLEIAALCRDLNAAFPWLKEYLRDCRVGDIYSSHDLTSLITGKLKEVEKDKGKSIVEAKARQQEKIKTKTRMPENNRIGNNKRRKHSSKKKVHLMER